MGKSKKFLTESERDEWIKNIMNIYRRMKNKTPEEGYYANCHFPILVLPNVYAPDFFTDSYWFSKELSSIIKKNSSVLEMGTGTGIISIYLGKFGVKNILATDIYPHAAQNAKSNIKKHNLSEIIEVRKGDIFEPVRKDEKFDYIFWAHPFNNSPVHIQDPLLATGMDYNYNSLRKYIEGARKHLSPDGKLLLGTGDSADLATIFEIAKKNEFEMELVVKEEVPLEYGNPLPIEYRIYEFVDKIREKRVHLF